MKRIFACVLIVLLLSILLVACDTTAPPNNTAPGVTITPNVSPSPADGNNIIQISRETPVPEIMKPVAQESETTSIRKRHK